MTEIPCYELQDGHGLRLKVMALGAGCLSCRVRTADGEDREVMLGHASPQDHLIEGGYLGRVVGRYANRIKGARFSLDGQAHVLRANEGQNQLHGGPDGFDRRIWQTQRASARQLDLRLVSEDGDQGFPGRLVVDLRYQVTGVGRVRISFDATCTAPCPVNLTSHAYFNLDGDRAIATAGVLNQHLQIAAGAYAPTDSELIPTGSLVAVEGTAFDFRQARRIGAALLDDAQQKLAGGYDHSFLLDARCAGAAEPAARAFSSDSALSLTLRTSYPALQFYSGNFLDQTRGRDGRPFKRHAGFALEPQFLPDSPNQPQWPQPDCVLRPGQRLQHFIEWQFHTPAAERL